MLENCMAFGVNEALKRTFPNSKHDDTTDGPPSLLKPFLMGALTGCFSATVLLPSVSAFEAIFSHSFDFLTNHLFLRKLSKQKRKSSLGNMYRRKK